VHDDQLFLAWRRGDRDAGNKLARRYHSALHAFFRTRVPGAEVEELTQRVLLQTIAQPLRFRGASSFHHYVFTIARKTLAQRHRQSWRNREQPWQDEDAIDPQTPPSQRLLRREWSLRLREATAQLPEIYAKVLELHLAGLANHAIAGELGINYNTVRSRLSRAVESVRAMLVEHSEGLAPPPTAELGELLPHEDQLDSY
jgi:RNA polymerase sigma-70 factor (ECF subfamily)